MIDRRRLYALVFLAGGATLATEICASRLLAPYYGASTIVWANLIGLVLASLSVGYWLGGRLADRRPEPQLLGTIVVVAALLVAATPFLARPFLDVSVQGLDEASEGAAIGSFFATLVLFAPPVALLGMAAPFAIRLALGDVATAGTVAGRLYALSTLGSLLGTFVPALVTIPLVGTQRTMLGAASLLALGGGLVLRRRWLLAPIAVSALLAVPPGAVKATTGLLYERESRYQYVQVIARGGARYLQLDEGIAVHSVWRPDDVLTGGEWDVFVAMPALLPRDPARVAILGNAGGTTARAYGRYFPRTEIDGVELDPLVTDVGRRFFGLGDNPRLHVYDADARPFLRSTRARYDVIAVDAYRPPYVPFYLASVEFFRLAHERLAPGGLLVMNVATVPGDYRLAHGVESTLRAVFRHVYVWQALRFNRFVIASDRALRVRDAGPRALLPLLRRGLRESQAHDEPWTDDRSPVEWITDRMIIEFAAEGGRLDEMPLPTGP